MIKGLIVDDAYIMRLRLREILEQNGNYTIIGEASNGIEAIKQYDIHKPDFVTLDISMPQMNGIEALKRLIEKFKDAQIVIVSAVGQKQMVFEALALGAKDFILKPFDAERVLKSIDRLFSES